MDGREDGMEGWVVNAKGVVGLTAVKCAGERVSVNDATPSPFLSPL